MSVRVAPASPVISEATPVPHKYVSPTDKLARQMLKACVQRPLGSVLPLSLIESWFPKEAPDAIRNAITHAVRQGWLIQAIHGWMPTPAGEEIGRHSRAGIRNKTRFF